MTGSTTSPTTNLTKNDHFRDLAAARQRGFRPGTVHFDGWCSSLENLKRIRNRGWSFRTQLESNRKVDLARQGPQAVAAIPIPAEGAAVRLEGFESSRVFKAASRDGDVEYWATNDPTMNEVQRLELAERCRAVEKHHRVL